MSDPPDKSESSSAEERRETLARIALGGGIFALGGVGYLTFRLVRCDDRSFDGDVRTGILPQRVGEKVITLPRVFLLRDSQGALLALDRRCTHQKCRVRAATGGRSLLCPCHGSRFDLQGNPQGGPAKRPLRKLRTSLDKKGRVVVHFR